MHDRILGGPPIDDELAAIAERLRRSTIQVQGRGDSHGSGIIAASDGVIVTNAHVTRRRDARVIFSDGNEAAATVTAWDAGRDLAVMHVDASGLPAPELRDARTLRPGDVVLAVGNPFDLVGALTAGVVHVADRRGRRVVADLRLRPGNSGGPLADAEGKIVGVNAMVVGGLAVAISSETVRRFLAAPAARPYIGVVTQPARIDVMGERRLGLLVVELRDRGPADRAGLLVGDAIIGVD